MQLIFINQIYDRPGGAQNLVYEISKIAYSTHGITSIHIGKKQSFVFRRLTENRIPFRHVEEGNLKSIGPVTSAEDLIINFNNFDGLDKYLELNGKIILWGILAHDITGWNRFGFETKLTGKKTLGNYFNRRLINKMVENNAIVAMDGATSDFIEKFVNKNLDLPIIPVPVDVSDIRLPNKIRNYGLRPRLNISYIGRSDDLWKIKPIKKIIQDLSLINNVKFNLRIYTDNAHPFVSEIGEFISDNICIEYLIGMYGKELRSHLSMFSDLHFSMGTAALEGALAAIPTILVDPSRSDMPRNYRYKWLFQTTRMSLGRFIEDDQIILDGMEMTEVIASVCEESQREHIIAAGMDYVLRNHSALTVANKVINHSTLASMSDLCRNTPATWSIITKSKSLITNFF